MTEPNAADPGRPSGPSPTPEALPKAEQVPKEVVSAEAPRTEAPKEEQVPPAEPPAAACRACGGEPEAGYPFPLCASCRTALARWPFPGWIQAGALLVLVALAVAGARSPSAVEAGVAFERGRRAEKQGHFAQAADDYQRVADRFPDSTKVLTRLAVARFRAGQFAEAARVVGRLAGRKLSGDEVKEVAEVVRALRVRLPVAEE